MSKPVRTVSWLELERHALGELPPDQDREVAAALAACEHSRECLERIASGPGALPALPVVEARPGWRARWRAGWVGWAGVAVAAACALLVMTRDDAVVSDSRVMPGPRARVKGGDLVIGLVRERHGQISLDPADLAPGDRFKVVLTCPPDMRLRGEILVLQGGQASLPLASLDLACGNRVTVPGAFAFSAAGEARVCAVLGEEPLDRDVLAAAPDTWPAAVCAPLAARP